MLVLGVDPGRSAALALVECRPGARPRLVGSWSVWGTPSIWWGRLQEALRGLPLAEVTTLAIERPAADGRQRAEVRAERGPATWLGMGWRAGLIEGAVRSAAPALADVRHVDSGAWPRALRLPPGKQAHGQFARGWHRVIEAQTLGVGLPAEVVRQPDITAAAQERLVSRSEAALIALAAHTL